MIPNSDLRYVDRAEVYKDGDLAGTLTRERNETVFRYDPRYIDADLPPVATTLPLTRSIVSLTGGALPPFFTNLLPEGVRLLGLKDRTKTSLDDEMTLLLAVGRDCVGDVAVVPEGEDPDASPEETVAWHSRWMGGMTVGSEAGSSSSSGGTVYPRARSTAPLTAFATPPRLGSNGWRRSASTRRGRPTCAASSSGAARI